MIKETSHDNTQDPWSVLCIAFLSATTSHAEDGSSTKSFTYKKTKQADLEMVVHYPPGWRESDMRPGIVFFFGGGWEHGTNKQFEPQATHLASRGMVAVMRWRTGQARPTKTGEAT